MLAVEAGFELSPDIFAEVLFGPLHDTLGFVTIYQSTNVKFFKLPQCFTDSLIL